jgi:hypothetical protein
LRRGRGRRGLGRARGVEIEGQAAGKRERGDREEQGESCRHAQSLQQRLTLEVPGDPLPGEVNKMVGVEVVRIHDPARRPASWAGIIRPGQFVVFATPSDGTCVLFESMGEARAFCEAGVLAAPGTRFDVFDAQGRAQPPLLTVVHPSREPTLDTHPRTLHRRRVIAWALIIAGVLLILFTYWKFSAIEAIFPGVIGINMLLAGGRLLWFNLGVRETERAREDRVAELDSGRKGSA